MQPVHRTSRWKSTTATGGKWFKWVTIKDMDIIKNTQTGCVQTPAGSYAASNVTFHIRLTVGTEQEKILFTEREKLKIAMETTLKNATYMYSYIPYGSLKVTFTQDQSPLWSSCRQSSPLQHTAGIIDTIWSQSEGIRPAASWFLHYVRLCEPTDFHKVWWKQNLIASFTFTDCTGLREKSGMFRGWMFV